MSVIARLHQLSLASADEASKGGLLSACRHSEPESGLEAWGVNHKAASLLRPGVICSGLSLTVAYI